MSSIVSRVLLALAIAFPALAVSRPVEAASAAMRPVIQREVRSRQQCEEMRKVKGSAYREGECKSLSEQVAGDPTAKWWIIGIIVLALLGAALLPELFRSRAGKKNPKDN
jgi:hypothetical protein